MILTPLADAGRYAGLHPLFGRAFAWCAVAANLRSAIGTHVIIPDGLTVIVDEGSTRDDAGARLESHRANIDIQVNLSGGEAMEWAPRAGLTLDQDFAPGGDIAFWKQPPLAARFLVAPGHAAIFWPEDAHKPILHPASGRVAYRKMVFKVRI